MDVTEAIETRIELKSYADEPVDEATKRSVLEAARLAPSGRNLQHWRFVLVDDESMLDELGDRAPSGGWVANADFAVAVCTDPSLSFNELDAGRAITHMQFAAWSEGVGSRIFTTDELSVRELLAVPDKYDLTAIVGFGYPDRDVVGQKDRESLEDVAFRGRFGEPAEW